MIKGYSCHLNLLVHGSQLGQKTSEIKPEEQDDSFISTHKNTNQECQEIEKTIDKDDSDDKQMVKTDSETICTTQDELEDDLKSVDVCSETQLSHDLDVKTDKYLDSSKQEHDSDQEDVSVGFIRGIFGVLYKG